jgi:hypothetical protein
MLVMSSALRAHGLHLAERVGHDLIDGVNPLLGGRSAAERVGRRHDRSLVWARR